MTFYQLNFRYLESSRMYQMFKKGLFHVIALLDLLAENELQNSMLIIQKNVAKTRVNTINYV